MTGQSNKERFKSVKLAADQGDAESQFKVGNMYRVGQGTSTNHKEAFTYFKKAADQGHAKAQFNSGLMYYNGLGVTQNYEEASRMPRRQLIKGCRSSVQLGFDVLQWPRSYAKL